MHSRELKGRYELKFKIRIKYDKLKYSTTCTVSTNKENSRRVPIIIGDYKDIKAALLLVWIKEFFNGVLVTADNNFLQKLEEKEPTMEYVEKEILDKLGYTLTKIDSHRYVIEEKEYDNNSILG